ncbi:MAG: phenol hydroxylase subunit [Rhodomicrobium sp.]
MVSSQAAGAWSCASAGKTFVKVKGTRLGKFIEFEFSINDEDLTIELILPVAAFREFCASQSVTILPSDPSAEVDAERAAWRAGQPGLLRRPAQDD